MYALSFLWKLNTNILSYGADIPLNVPLPVGDIEPLLTHGSLGPPESSFQTASQSVQPFLHSSRYSVPLLHNALKKLSLLLGDRGPRLIHGTKGPPKSPPQTVSRLAQLFLRAHERDNRQTHWHTDRPHLCSNRPLLLDAMRPNNSIALLLCVADERYNSNGHVGILLPAFQKQYTRSLICKVVLYV